MSGLLIDDLTAWLAQQASLTVNTDLFKANLPEDSALATVIRSTGGPTRRYGPVLVATFQVLTRGPGDNYAAVNGRAMALYNVIYPTPTRLPVRNVDLSDDWRAHAIDAVQPPTDLGLSESGKWQVVFNVILRAVRLSE